MSLILIISFPNEESGWKPVMSVTTPDISATMLELSGIDIPDTFEGESFANNLVSGTDNPDKASLYMSVSSFAAVRKEYKKAYRAIKTSEYTYIKTVDGPWMLFDDKKDPFQENNLVSDPASDGILDKMDGILMQQLDRINDDFQPAEYYIEKWGYNIRPAGHIPYGSHEQVVQSPKK